MLTDQVDALSELLSRKRAVAVLVHRAEELPKPDFFFRVNELVGDILEKRALQLPLLVEGGQVLHAVQLCDRLLSFAHLGGLLLGVVGDPGVLEGLGSGYSVIGVFLEHLLDEVLGGGGDVGPLLGREGELALLDAW